MGEDVEGVGVRDGTELGWMDFVGPREGLEEGKDEALGLSVGTLVTGAGVGELV